MNIRIKRLHGDAVIPQYAHVGDSGFDLVAVEDVIVEPGQTVKVPTGLAFEIPEGYELQVRPRSGVTSKTKLRVQFGTVDSGYRGEVAVMVDNTAQPDKYIKSGSLVVHNCDQIGYRAADGGFTLNGIPYADHTDISKLQRTEGSYIIRRGDRIAQSVIAPVVTATFTEADELTDTQRNDGGFGSTGT